MLGLRDHMRIVRSLGGYLDDIPPTRSRFTRGQAPAEHDLYSRNLKESR